MMTQKLKKSLSIFTLAVFLLNSLSAQPVWGSEIGEEVNNHKTYSQERSAKGEDQNDSKTSSSPLSDNNESSSHNDRESFSQPHLQSTETSLLSWEERYYGKANACWKLSEGWFNRAGAVLSVLGIPLKGLLLYDGLSDDAKIIVGGIAITCDAASVFLHTMENYAEARNKQPYIVGQRVTFGSALERATCCVKCLNCCCCCKRVSKNWFNALGTIAAASGAFFTTVETASSLPSLAKTILKVGALVSSTTSCGCHIVESYLKGIFGDSGNTDLDSTDENDPSPKREIGAVTPRGVTEI